MAAVYTDTEIRQNVWDEISHDVRIDPTNITVSVIDGVVYLNGTVPTYSMKVAAGQDARRIKGVVDVVNNLTVQTSQIWTNQEIRDAVRANIDLDSRITNPANINVSVQYGVVTLSGTVPNYGQKAAAADDAWTVPGVVDVINNIVVAPSSKRSDSEIENEVRRVLDNDPDINAARIRVSVVDGVVYLRGSAPAYYQIQEASDDAWSVPGVVDVVNELTVAT